MKTAFVDLPLAQRLMLKSMSASERRAFKRYAVMRGGDPARALTAWIERHAAPEDDVLAGKHFCGGSSVCPSCADIPRDI